MWGEQDQRELDEAIDARKREKVEQVRLHRIRSFLEAYPIDGPVSFTYAQAEQLADSKADYHLAAQLAKAGCPPDQAIRILL